MESVINYKAVDDMTFLEKIKFLANFISKIILYAMFFLLLLVFLVFVIYFFDLFYNLKSGNNTPPLFNAYVIVSPSMVPTIKVNDAIVIRREEEIELKKGDIITFSSNDPRYSGLTVTHRIVGIQVSKSGKRLYRTKGDANNVEDSSLLEYDDIYGKVIFKIPGIGYIRSFLVNSYGWLLLIVIPCLTVLVYDIVKVYKNIHNRVRNKNNLNDIIDENNQKDDKDDNIDPEIL